MKSAPDAITYFPTNTAEYRWVATPLSADTAPHYAAASVIMQAEQFPDLFPRKTLAIDTIADYYNPEDPERIEQEAKLLAGDVNETF